MIHRTLSLFVVCIMCTQLALAYDFAVNNIYYKTTGIKTVEVTYKDTNYNSYSGSVTIPSSVTYNGITYQVTAIGTYAFHRSSGLTNVSIPSSVTTVGAYAFHSCSGMTNLAMGNSLSTIGESAFFGCSSLSNITIPNSVTSIGTCAFQGCSGMTSLTIGNSVATIAKSAFYNCSALTSVLIPNSVTSLGESAFSLCTGMKSVTIGSSVTKISYNAFYGCRGLTSVTMGNSVTSIDKNAFYGCSSLTNMVVPNSVTTIGDHAFYGCSCMTSLTLGTGLSSIGSNAFNGCTALSSIRSNSTTSPTIQSNTFISTQYHNATLFVPTLMAVSNYQAANYWRNFNNIQVVPTLNEALNITNGNIEFATNVNYPWTVEIADGRIYAQSGNAGLHSCTSTLTAQINTQAEATLSFDFKAWGEGTSMLYDKCVFMIDGEECFSYGALQNDWETYSTDLTAGSHTLTWAYSKDSSMNPDGDYFAVDNIAISSKVVSGDVNGDGGVTISDVTALIDLLLGAGTAPVTADVNGDGVISILDVSSLIDMLLQ